MKLEAAPSFDKTDGRTIRSDFLDQATQRPDAPALRVRGVDRSYAYLDQTSRTWAHAIQRILDKPAKRIGVFAYRSEVSYVGVLTALATGAAFVPLNPTFAAGKTRSMIAQAELDFVIVDKMCASQVQSVLEGVASPPPLLLPEVDEASFAIRSTMLTAKDILAANPLQDLPPLVPEDIAYILFTSGSTGTPKGVPVSHGNVQHFVEVVRKRYGITPADRFSQTFDQTFDLSVFDLFVAWSSGACVCSMAGVDLLSPVGFVNKNEISVWFSVPSVPAQMRKRNSLNRNTMPGLRWSLFCGEPLHRASATAWQEAAPNSVVENLYGPTELTIACLVHRWNPELSPKRCVNDLVPIGRPLDGLCAVVCDENMQPVPPESVGELCVSGPQTTPGYWKDEQKTQERFVWMQTCEGEKRRFYRTGDRVFRGKDGEYHFIGRADHQIKVLGYRVELGEVEAALMQIAGVAQAIALGWPIQEGSAQGIIAFVTGENLDAIKIQKEAASRLAAYMTPTRVLIETEMPLNANGKVDRTALQLRLGQNNVVASG